MIPQAWRAGARRPLKYKTMNRPNDFLKLVPVSNLNALFLTPLQGENKNFLDEQRTRPKTMKNTAAPPFPLTRPAFAHTFSIQPLAFPLTPLYIQSPIRIEDLLPRQR